MPTELLGTTEENSRRNLFVLSCLIIIGWYLDLNLATLISQTLGVGLDPFKVNIVYLVLLTYLALTFLRSSHTNAMLSMYNNHTAPKIYLSLRLSEAKDNINTHEKKIDVAELIRRGRELKIQRSEFEASSKTIVSYTYRYTIFLWNALHSFCKSKFNLKNFFEHFDLDLIFFYKSSEDSLLDNREININISIPSKLFFLYLWLRFIWLPFRTILTFQKVVVYYLTVFLVAISAFVILSNALCVEWNAPPH